MNTRLLADWFNPAHTLQSLALTHALTLPELALWANHPDTRAAIDAIATLQQGRQRDLRRTLRQPSPQRRTFTDKARAMLDALHATAADPTTPRPKAQDHAPVPAPSPRETAPPLESNGPSASSLRHSVSSSSPQTSPASALRYRAGTSTQIRAPAA